MVIKMQKKSFLLKFDLTPGNIQTQMKTQNISPQEAIGLLEMAKDQILDNLKKGIEYLNADDEMKSLIVTTLRNSSLLIQDKLRPLELAKKWNKNILDELELLFNATQSKLLDLKWYLICPSCNQTGHFY